MKEQNHLKDDQKKWTASFFPDAAYATVCFHQLTEEYCSLTESSRTSSVSTGIFLYLHVLAVMHSSCLDLLRYGHCQKS
ncbi:hypothetical protein JOB18_024798 [Solea senegalensis]|uniref:Uncharacterized protein n=1 Tax=Solea senegalensis TaxID=28829 RepID=A0AAV6RYD7_SOLSE|nr:hypothetical protein JOB18_024798 [Solea senegalensis]